MKTVFEHIQALPPKIRMAFIKEAERQRSGKLTDISRSLSDSITHNINWSATKQGYDFWDKLYMKIARAGK